jgi:hypothetical protein
MGTSVGVGTGTKVKVSPTSVKKSGGYAKTSDGVKGGTSQRTARIPLVLKGVEPPKRQTIPVSMFGLVDVDKRYQRDQISEEIGDLIYVLQHGGVIPDPITVVRRKYAEDGVVSNKLWIIDGQQRFMAHMEVGKPIDAQVHDVHSLEEERAFFIVMNTRKTVSSNRIVNSWAGKSAELIRRVDVESTHPLYGRISFNTNGQSVIGAAIIARGLCAVLCLDSATGDTKSVLNKVDRELGKGGIQALRAEAYLSLIGRVFPKGYAPVLPIIALGEVARERWEAHLVTPSPTVIGRVSRINWRNEAPSWAIRFLPLLVNKVRKVWK